MIRLDHVSVLVSDVERSATFYQDVLGLVIIRRSGDPVSGIWLGADEKTDFLHLNQGAPAALPPPKDNHFAFRTSSFDQLLRHLKHANIEFFDWPGNAGIVGRHPLGFRQIYLKDPDGYWVEVNDVSR